MVQLYYYWFNWNKRVSCTICKTSKVKLSMTFVCLRRILSFNLSYFWATGKIHVATATLYQHLLTAARDRSTMTGMDSDQQHHTRTMLTTSLAKTGSRKHSFLDVQFPNDKLSDDMTPPPRPRMTSWLSFHTPFPMINPTPYYHSSPPLSIFRVFSPSLSRFLPLFPVKDPLFEKQQSWRHCSTDEYNAYNEYHMSSSKPIPPRHCLTQRHYLLSINSVLQPTTENPSNTPGNMIRSTPNDQAKPNTRTLMRIRYCIPHNGISRVTRSVIAYKHTRHHRLLTRVPLSRKFVPPACTSVSHHRIDHQNSEYSASPHTKAILHDFLWFLS